MTLSRPIIDDPRAAAELERKRIWDMLQRRRISVATLADGRAKRCRFVGDLAETIEVYRARGRAWNAARRWATAQLAEAEAERPAEPAPEPKAKPKRAPRKKKAA